MPYIIDGHNLIGALPDIALDDAQDERALLELLQPLSQRENRSIYIYFDRGNIGGRNSYTVGRLHIHFSVPPRTADDAIVTQLRSIGREGPNWVVVTSDREILIEAENAGARTMTSREFIDELLSQNHAGQASEKPDRPLSEQDIDAWEALFNEQSEET
jgi:predicted RNA-binding protein with PIN domain